MAGVRKKREGGFWVREKREALPFERPRRRPDGAVPCASLNERLGVLYLVKGAYPRSWLKK